MSLSSRQPARGDRPYDIIVWGATGYTGALIARYLAQHAPLNGILFAVAGRSQSKLAALASSVAAHPTSSLSSPPTILTADLSSNESLTALTAQCRTLIAAVGPFAQYGEPVLAAAVSTHTDYVDVTGEVHWVKLMHARYQARAQSNRVLLLPMSGMDSLPSELCAVFALEEWERRFGPATGPMHVQSYVSTKGELSGGTVATMVASIEQRQQQHGDVALYLLALPGYAEAKKQQGAQEKLQLLPRWSDDLHAFTAPFLMAVANTQAVRRTLSFYANFDRRFQHVTYNEAMRTSANPVLSLLYSAIVTLALLIAALLIVFPPTRALLQRFVLPSSGQGPADSDRNRYWMTCRTYAREVSTKRKVAVEMTGGEAYWLTAALASQTAMLVVKHREVYMNKGGGGGFGSVGYMMAAELRQRLMKDGGTTFRVLQ